MLAGAVIAPAAERRVRIIELTAEELHPATAGFQVAEHGVLF
jgi:hypothetical protein